MSSLLKHGSHLFWSLDIYIEMIFIIFLQVPIYAIWASVHTTIIVIPKVCQCGQTHSHNISWFRNSDLSLYFRDSFSFAIFVTLFKYILANPYLLISMQCMQAVIHTTLSHMHDYTWNIASYLWGNGWKMNFDVKWLRHWQHPGYSCGKMYFCVGRYYCHSV